MLHSSQNAVCDLVCFPWSKYTAAEWHQRHRVFFLRSKIFAQLSFLKTNRWITTISAVLTVISIIIVSGWTGCTVSHWVIGLGDNYPESGSFVIMEIRLKWLIYLPQIVWPPPPVIIPILRFSFERLFHSNFL